MEALEDRPYILDFVKTVANEQGIEHCSITKVKCNEKGKGYLGQIFMVTVEDVRSQKQMDLVVKVAFTDEKIRSSGAIQDYYKNEGYFYLKLYPALKKFERSKGITEEFELVPMCYKAILDNNKEVLCFENLVCANFEVFDKKTPLDHDHVSFIFKTYGRFHAYSLALQDQQPEEYKKLTAPLLNVFESMCANLKGGFAPFLKEMQKLTTKYLIPGEDDEVIEKFAKYEGNAIVDIFLKIVTEKCDLSVITHGDCWSNNMMFKYEKTETGKKLVDMRLLDLQFAKVGSPVCDLSLCLYSGASKSVLDNLDEYLRIYYDSLTSFSRKLGSDPEKLFPFEVLKKQWNTYSKFGMIMGIMSIKMKCTDKEDIQDFTDGLIEDEMLNQIYAAKFDEKTYQQRVRDLFHHMSDLDAL